MSVGYVPYVGYASDLLYGIESTFRNAATLSRRFGNGQTLDTLSINRNYDRVFTLGSRKLQKHIYNTFSASIGVGFRLSDIEIFNTIFDCTTDEYGVTTCQMPYKGKSITVGVYLSKDRQTFDLLKFPGTVVQTMRMSVAPNRAVNVSLTMASGDIEITTGAGSPPSFEYGTNIGQYVFTFAGATVKFDDVELPATNLSVTFNPNVSLKYFLGSDRAGTFIGNQFLITGTVTVLLGDLTYFNKLMNNQAVTIEMILKGYDNTGNTEGKTITMTFSGIQKLENISSPIRDLSGVTADYAFISSDVTITDG